MSRPPTTKEMAELLHLQTYSGSFHMAIPCKKYSFRVEGYVDETKVFEASSGSVSGSKDFAAGKVSYRIQIVDLDILKLPEAKAGYHRFVVQILHQNGGGTQASTDIKKKTFDLESLRSGTFHPPYQISRGIKKPAVQTLGRTEIFRRYLPSSIVKRQDGSSHFVQSKEHIVGYFMSE